MKKKASRKRLKQPRCGLTDKDYPSTTINILKEQKEIMSKELKESVTVVPLQVEYINKEKGL